MEYINIPAQIIGIIGYILYAASFYKKEKIQILLFQIMASVMFGVQYYLLGGISGAACNIISMFALVLIYVFEKKKTNNKKLLVRIISYNTTNNSCDNI